MGAQELHDKVMKAFNPADVEALVALYEPDARMVRDDGSIAVGPEEIREVWAGFTALAGKIQLTTVESVEHGDLALLSNVWVFSGDGFEIGARTAEVARRQVDGSWRYVIDHPFGGGMTPAGD